MLTNKDRSTTHETGTFEARLFGSERTIYPERGKISDVLQYTPDYIPVNSGIPRCATSFLVGGCNLHEHKYVKLVVCEREYCEDCGRKGSYAHGRRIARWRPRALSMKKMGYMIITIPEEQRDLMFEAANLQKFRKYIMRKLRRTGFESDKAKEFESELTLIGKKKKGRRRRIVTSDNAIPRALTRFHWFGDCTWCNGKECSKCNYTGCGDKFHPHLNILLEGGKMDKKVMETFKVEVGEWMQENLGAKKGTKANLFYQYSTPQTDPYFARTVNHWLKYVLRSTFRTYNYKLANTLKGFRNNLAYGRFTLKGTTKDSTTAIEHNMCICCLQQYGSYERIKWGRELQDTAKSKEFLRQFTKIKHGMYVALTKSVDLKPCRNTRNIEALPMRC